MPELNTALNLAEDFAAGDVPNIGPDDVAAVLDGYQGLALAVSDQSKRAREAESRAAAAEAAIRRVERIHCWRNEDGRQFLFADDVRAALGAGGSDA